MAEEAQAPECKENENPEITPVQIIDVIDNVDMSSTCETSQCDSMLTSGGPDIILEDKTVAPAVVLNDKNEEEQREEHSIILEKGPDVLDNHGIGIEENNEGSCPTRVEIDAGTAPLPSLEDMSKENEDGDKTETPDILLHQESRHSSETSTEEVLTETEEENTSIETDTEYGDGLYDEQDNGPQQSLDVSDSQEIAGSRPDIPINSGSGYDTVSYRKIRKGNTKQRIDEFESMMNL
ncbi:ermin [Eleutherodactylus coqui]|uniref:ermin n=1 Tax=Eleutherodactylus coqui TaxID=57060 RepID=UPI00346332DB